jgi:hypothetical protein
MIAMHLHGLSGVPMSIRTRDTRRRDERPHASITR